MSECQPDPSTENDLEKELDELNIQVSLASMRCQLLNKRLNKINASLVGLELRTVTLAIQMANQ